MLRSLICAFVGHRVNRNRVRHDGRDFIGHCRRCHAPMVREPDGWRRMDRDDSRNYEGTD